MMAAGHLSPHCLIPGLGPGCSPGSLIGDAVHALLAGLAAWIADAAAYLVGQVGQLLSATTTIDLSSSWFERHYTATISLSAAAALLALLAAAVDAVVHQEPRLLWRAAALHLPLAALGTALAVALTKLLLATVDQLCGAFGTVSGGGQRTLLESLIRALGSGGLMSDHQVPGAVVLVGAILAILATLALWFELLLRSAAIYVVVLLLPMVLAAQVWPTLARFTRRTLELLASLICSKLVVVAVLSLATDALGQGLQHNSVATLLTGVALCGLAACSPVLLLRLMPLAEAAAAVGLDGHRPRATRALRSPALSGAGALQGALATLGPSFDDLLASASAPGPLPRASDVGLSVIPPPPPTPPSASTETRPAPPGLFGTHRIGRDHLGPVLRYEPEGR